ncbi:hypothetical protein VTI74DRAFT_10675 [Chaetomium olivicolor]
MPAMEAANAHYNHNGHSSQQPGTGPLPASPTLTNPDMILPDYDRSDSPDPDLGHGHSHPQLMTWNNAHVATSAENIHQMFVATGMVGPRGGYGASGPVTPTTPIIYGNGTMLSDIGEVTEVESTVGKPSPARTTATKPAAGASGSDTALRSSPTMGAAGAAGALRKKSKQSLRAKRERRSSIESNSTITTEDNPGMFADFDDSVSVGDSVFQGDDEESMASSYVEGTEAIEPARLGVARAENLDRLSTYSTTSLSRRAEEILANAKKRLTTMEGNLTRARSSLHNASPYGSDGSTPSPPFQRASTATYQRYDDGDDGPCPTDHGLGHTRMSSDVAMRNGIPYRVSLPRSQSALGAAGGYRQPLTASKSADYIRGDLNQAGSVREGGPKSLTEDEVKRLGEADSATQNARLEAFLSPTFGSFHSDSGMRTQRSASAAQMRDIKDQMRDLKGKISSLREQARADNLKRRSLQSLRTPSPFTHAQIDQWYAEPRSNRTSQVITGTLPERNPWNGEETSVDGDAREEEHHVDEQAEETDYVDAENGIHPENAGFHQSEPVFPMTPDHEAHGVVEDDVSDMLTENGEVDEDFHDADDADYMSESGESLYHDTVQHQISHEDREDAFDYEHFFLHSAMGTMSLTRRASTESFTSEDSVETTKGPVANGTSGDYGREPRPVHSRRNSSNSISTIDTFATAQEGRSLKSPVIPEEGHGVYDSSSHAPSAQSNRYRSGSTKRHSVNPVPTPAARDSDGSISPIAEESSATSSPAHTASASAHQSRRASVIHRPISAAATSSLHRPSISSFDSVGTNRSFPLVPNKHGCHGAGSNKANSTGALTPRDSSSSSPDYELNSISSRLMSDLSSAYNSLQHSQHSKEDGEGGGGKLEREHHQHQHPLEALLREDKYLVERLVASLGRCVLGLTEHGRASAESRVFRRRIDAARRVLEGVDDAAGAE